MSAREPLADGIGGSRSRPLRTEDHLSRGSLSPTQSCACRRPAGASILPEWIDAWLLTCQRAQKGADGLSARNGTPAQAVLDVPPFNRSRPAAPMTIRFDGAEATMSVMAELRQQLKPLADREESHRTRGCGPKTNSRGPVPKAMRARCGPESRGRSNPLPVDVVAC